MIGATKCYICTSLDDESCRTKQDPVSSYYLDCAKFTPISGDNYTCAKLEYDEGRYTSIKAKVQCIID
nr:unnamed protein product [Callosobruchus chinensis]